MGYKYEEIRDQIVADALRTGVDLLPSEHQICKRYGVSRTTAVKAFNSLKEHNLVRREVGRGTFLRREMLKTSVTFLVGEDRTFNDFARQAAEVFMRKQPDTRISLQYVPKNEDWLRTIVTTPGTKVLFCSHTGFLAADGLLLPLEDQPGFQATLQQIAAEYVAWLPGTTGKRHCHALPVMLAPAVLAFNRRYARELNLNPGGPKSWDDIRRWFGACRNAPFPAAQMKRNNVLPLSYYLTLTGGRHFIREQGNRVSFNFECGEQWLAFFQELHRTGQMPEYPAGVPEPLLDGEALMTFDANTWIVNQSRDKGIAEDITVTPVPPVEPGLPSFADVGKPELAILRDAESTEKQVTAAWNWIRFLVSDPDIQRLLVDKMSCLAVNREVYREQQADPVWFPFIQALATGRIRCDHAVQHYLMRTVYRNFYAAVLDDLPCAEAARRIQEGGSLLLDVTS